MGRKFKDEEVQRQLKLAPFKNHGGAER